MRKLKKVLIAVVIVAVIIVIACSVYIGDYSHNEDENALTSTETVVVTEKDYGYFYDGPGTQDAFVFYPGGKVEDIAYSDLLKKIAEKGIDCFLMTMPGNLAFLKNDAADKVINGDYENWFIGGHSLGGVASSMYASDNAGKIKGIIFLAAYSSEDLSGSNLKALSLYGSNDGVLNKSEYDKAKSNLPTGYIEYIIEGGNHSQFGTYGLQDGDNESTITGEDQRKTSAEKIAEFIGE